MMRGFLADRRGNYALMTVVAMVPLMGGLAFAVDFAEMNRQKQAVDNALDAAGIATARQVVTGASEAELLAYAKNFFEANLGSVDPADTQLTVVLPANQVGGGTLKLSAQLNYKPLFFPVFAELIGTPEEAANADISFVTRTEIRLKNTLEVALVLDNSGSMDNYHRRPARSASTCSRLRPRNSSRRWRIRRSSSSRSTSRCSFRWCRSRLRSMSDRRMPARPGWTSNGLSPVHQENFDWSTLNAPNKTAEKIGGIWYKKGTGWGEEEGQMLTRYSLYRDMKVVTSHERVAGSERVVCDEYRANHTCKRDHKEYDYVDTYGPFASWQGCVEARPYPYNTNDAPARRLEQYRHRLRRSGDMFVPMFAPDEPGNHW